MEAPAFIALRTFSRIPRRTRLARLAGAGNGSMTSTTVGAAAETPLPRKAGRAAVTKRMPVAT